MACRVLPVCLGQRPALRFTGEPATEMACDHGRLLGRSDGTGVPGMRAHCDSLRCAGGVLAVLAQVTALRGRVGPGWVGHAW